jgi:hypothetical protein
MLARDHHPRAIRIVLGDREAVLAHGRTYVRMLVKSADSPLSADSAPQRSSGNRGGHDPRAKAPTARPLARRPTEQRCKKIGTDRNHERSTAPPQASVTGFGWRPRTGWGSRHRRSTIRSSGGSRGTTTPTASRRDGVAVLSGGTA